MTPGLKDKLFMLCINQEKGDLRYSTYFHHLIFYAAMLELVNRNKVFLSQGVWTISDQQTGDRVLDEVILIAQKHYVTKSVWFSSNISTRTSKLLSKQVEWMVENKWIEATKTSFLGIPTGHRFRIRKPESLRPDLQNLERVLIYGRKPTPEVWMLIQLLGAPKILNQLFRNNEWKQKARKRYKELYNDPPLEQAEAYAAIVRKLKETVISSLPQFRRLTHRVDNTHAVLFPMFEI